MSYSSTEQYVKLPRDSNQARGIAQYALDMIQGRHAGPSDAVLEKVEQFHLDSIACGVSALAAGANAPTVLRAEALDYRAGDLDDGVPMFGSSVRVAPEKAVLACSSAVREWDANGTNFGYNPARRDGRRIRAQRLLSGCRGGRSVGWMRRPANPAGDGRVGRNSRPAGRGVRAQPP
jgi:hypothetical protein